MALVLATTLIFTALVYITKPELVIIDAPIAFSKKRIELTKAYIKKHYDLNVSSIAIEPKIIVLHWTENHSLQESFKLFNHETIDRNSSIVAKAGAVNVSAHFLIDRKGHIYRIMPETQMARHVIGLNFHAIGIENIGGLKKDGTAQADLTWAQREANIRLVRFLKHKYPKIEYLIGHYEYQAFEKTPLWMEKDPTYRTKKDDPNPEFVEKVYEATKDLGLKRAPKE